MFNGPLMLQVNWTKVDKIHPESNTFVTCVKINATVASELSDSPEHYSVGLDGAN